MSAPMEVDKHVTEVVPLDLTMKNEDNCGVSVAEVELYGIGKSTEDEALEPLDLSMKKQDNFPVLEMETESDGPGKLTKDEALVPLDLSVKKQDNCVVSKVEAERDGPGKLTEDEALVSLDLSTGREFPLQPPAPSPPSQPQPQRTMDSPSPVMATERLALLRGMYADDVAYRQMTSPATVPEYNPFLPVLPTIVNTQNDRQNHIYHQLQHIYMQQQHQLHIQQQLQSHLQHLHEKELQMHAFYGGIPLDSDLIPSGSPVHAATSSPSSSESNHLPSLTTDEQQQQQLGVDREHHHRIEACATDDVQSVVDPEEVAAIYRQADFLWFRQRYMESLGPPRNVEKMSGSRNQNNNNNNDNNNSENCLTAGQQQCDHANEMKRLKRKEATKRLRDAKRKKFIENQISVQYLTKRVIEMKDMKRRLLNTNSDILIVD